MDPKRYRVHFRVFEEREMKPRRSEVTSRLVKAESQDSRPGLTDGRVIHPHPLHPRAAGWVFYYCS